MSGILSRPVSLATTSPRDYKVCCRQKEPTVARFDSHAPGAAAALARTLVAMTQTARNFYVGLTVLGALIALGWMLLRFGAAPVKLLRHDQQLTIHFVSDRADGLAEGSQLLYRGVGVGEITKLRRDENDRDVLIDAIVDNVPPLPGNVQAEVRTQSLISGQAVLTLELINPALAENTAAEASTMPGAIAPVLIPVQPIGQLRDGQILRATYVGTELIPPQIGQLASELQRTAHDLRAAGLITHLDESVRQAGDVLKSLRDYVDDPAMRQDIRDAITNFRTTTESTKHAAADIEAFSQKLGKISDQASDTITQARTTITHTQDDVDRVSTQVDNRLVQMSKLLDTVQSVAGKVDQGQGTAALLLNDPKLYQSLVDSSRELNSTILDLRRLLQQWEQEGVSLKLH
jgi:ABC-type transporter Mla subunit MlaD